MFTFISVTDAFDTASELAPCGLCAQVEIRKFYELGNFCDCAMEKQDGAASVLNIVSENVLKKGKYSSKWYPCKIELKDDNLTYQRIDPKVSLFLRKQFQTVSREALIFDFDIFFFKAENNASFQKQPQLSFITLCI